MFSHLRREKCTYYNHFLRSMSFCIRSLQASFYFFIHAIYPDVFQYSGSRIIRNIASRTQSQ